MDEKFPFRFSCLSVDEYSFQTTPLAPKSYSVSEWPKNLFQVKTLPHVEPPSCLRETKKCT